MEFEITNRPRFFFKETTKIPHGSRNEKAISDYVVEFAKSHNLKYVQDEVFNVIVYKDASEGYEAYEPLVLQAHLDMVCEKNKDCDLDFEKDPLELYVDDSGWLHAKGTTLGADDCVGVAYMLAILEDDSLKHPALECVFTTMEEIGLIGSTYIKPEDIHAHRMISLDGGGETSTMLSSAGGCQVNLTKKLNLVDNSDPTYMIGVRGLAGGHSGGEIHKEKGNSNQLAMRIIKEAMLNGLDINIVSYEGGLKDNAIPRETDVVFTCSSDFEALEASIAKSVDDIKVELEFSDNGFNLVFEKVDTAAKKADKTTSEQLVNYIYLMPNGFQHRSMAIEGLTLTSLNLGVVSTKDDTVSIIISIRSAIESGIENLVRILNTFADLLDFDFSTSARYPGWNFREQSDMRDIYAKCVKEIYGKELVTMAGHGGCECGVFNSLVNGMDIISLGPVAYGCHTPDEKLNLESFDRTYKLLCKVVSETK